MAILFFISVFVILYTYLLYPMLITLLGTFFGKRVEKRYQPVPVSIVLAVRDEEDHIERRLENLFQQDYPPELIEVIIASDGSADRTVDIAREVGGDRVRIVETGRRMGKAAAINLGIENASNGIVVFADARQRFEENVLAELTSMFHDSSVGAVSGELLLVKEESGDVSEGVGLYWEYEKLIRRKESAVDSVVGATGSIYAARKELIAPIPPYTLLDDFLIPMRIVLNGFRVIFVRSARAYDRVSKKASQEFARKVRTLSGNFQAFAIEPALLNPKKNRIFFQLVSHKVLRLVAPYFCVTALLSNLFLSGLFFGTTLVLQSLFYAAMLLGLTPLKRTRIGSPLRIAWTFGVLNAAAVAGLWVFLRRKEREIWRKTGANGLAGGRPSSPDNGS
ncbi:MAG: glycosyltransferase [Candidatus Latescibacteria bacterium]|nr:glycosyltransferase [Candidatus Latescibacterota bacterium]NIO01021.1 glycosyltransferase [Candidatus Latescibacterota bacterium]NIO27420.1 glycosyltransferase [Candidatus Latescibacterota bacterium]NIO54942.1 glycosyltransferase [Candidatus Latescibacterota bacterium]NIT01031.1 glycosyltransferase [Candidatus Latescibacterota bacterium]